MNLNLIRHAYLPDVTLGWLHAGTLKLASLEEAWHSDPDGPGGQRREKNLVESCIPDGLYELRPHFSEKYPLGVWYFLNENLGVYAPGTRPGGQTWGRDAVLIHSGNSVLDIEGCTLVGKKHGFDGNRFVVYDSRNSVAALRALLGGKETHTIRVRPSAGTNEVSP